MKIGLKLWSTNKQYTSHALALHQQGVFDYIELFVEPASESSLAYWEPFRIPFVLHAPHAYSGLNFSLLHLQKSNLSILPAIDEYSRTLHPLFVVFHPGVSGTVQETVRQITIAKAHFPSVFKNGLIENKPKLGLNGEKCIGYSTNDIDFIMRETQLGFCLDFGHAVCAAAEEKRSWEDSIDSFMQLHPSMFHLSDNFSSMSQDKHLHIGTGDYDIAWMLAKVGDEDLVTIETNKDSNENLDDFRRDSMAVKARRE